MKQNIEIEHQIVSRLINDDKRAFCELYAIYKPKLLFFSIRYLKSPEHAEDIVQETFLSIWQNRLSLNPDAPIAALLYTIVKNKTLNLLARLSMEKELKEKIESNAINNVEEAMDASDVNRIFLESLEKLTPKQKEVFQMSRIQMKPHKEIAQHLGISVYTVQEHISASLVTIRSYMKSILKKAYLLI